MVVSETAEKTYSRTIQTRQTTDLPAGEVLIRVHYSSLNYKDALSATGNKGVTRQYPHTPGIDAAGVVAASEDAKWQVGDEVIVTSYDLGMNTAGGFGAYIRVPSKWVLAKPTGLSLYEAMIYGTAGLTAGLCIAKLQQHGLSPEQGKVMVTGATGGVGCTAVAILAQLGYEVVAVTGKPTATDFLKSIGAKEVVGREALEDPNNRPLLKPLYAGAVDTVGGTLLATLLKSMQWGGAVACCGLVASPQLPTTVFPFILRDVSLLGVDSAETPMSKRVQVWEHLATDWKPANLASLARSCPLEGLDDAIDTILKGGILGRIVVDLQD